MDELLKHWWDHLKRVDFESLQDSDWEALCSPGAAGNSGCAQRINLARSIGALLDVPGGAGLLIQRWSESQEWRDAPIAALLVLRRALARHGSLSGDLRHLAMQMLNQLGSGNFHSERHPEGTFAAHRIRQFHGRKQRASPDVTTEKALPQPTGTHIDPGVLDQEPVCDPSLAFEIVQHFEAVVGGKSDDTSFDRRWLSLRVLQWALLTRDLEAEQRRQKTSYLSASQMRHTAAGERGDVQFMLAPEERGALNLDAWRLHQMRAATSASPTGTSDEELQSEIAAATSTQSHFHALLTAIGDIYPVAYDEITTYFSETQLPLVFIDDGELTIFSLLWCLRSVYNDLGANEIAAERIRRFLRLTDHDEMLNIGFTVTTDGRIPIWIEVDLPQFLKTLGIGARWGSAGSWFFTTRGCNAFAWLAGEIARLSDGQASTVSLEPASSFLTDTLSVKRLARESTPESPARRLHEAYEAFLSRLRDHGPFRMEHDTVPSASAEAAPDLLSALFDCALKSGLLNRGRPNPEDTAVLWDTEFISIARSPFLPLELLLRRNAPFPMHVLMIPFNRVAGSTLFKGEAPLSVGFVTIAGRAPRASHAMTKAPPTQWEATETQVQLSGYAPYWLCLAGMSGVITPIVLTEAVEKLAKYSAQQALLSAFSHETGKIGAYFAQNLHIELGRIFARDNQTGMHHADGSTLPAKVGQEWQGTIARLCESDPEWHDIDQWYIMPTPKAFGWLKALFAVWGGTRGLLTFLEIPETSETSFSSLLESLYVKGAHAGLIRWLLEDFPVLFGPADLRELKRVLGESPDDMSGERHNIEPAIIVMPADHSRSVFSEENVLAGTVSNHNRVRQMLVYESPEGIMEKLRFVHSLASGQVDEMTTSTTGGPDTSGAKAVFEYFVRGMLATISNIVFHTQFHTQGRGRIRLEVAWRHDWLDLTFVNDAIVKDDAGTNTPKFWTGTKGVCQYCFEHRLGGKYSWVKPRAGVPEFLTKIRVPAVATVPPEDGSAMTIEWMRMVP
jgi:hypothetical protein